jgi:NADPH:quinone reductase-like Zn-dependent oxidoreductase
MSKAGTTTKRMLAWAIESYGEPIRLMKIPVPETEPNDVLIRMQGAEVGDWDDLVRQGGWPMGRPFPLVLGLAGAGTVAAVGQAATDFAEGDPVWVYNYPMRHEGCRSPDHNGAWAEYMLVPDSYVAAAPASLNLTQAGSVPIVGLTAHETLIDILDVQRGEVVLITAAAGGVGHLAVQIAKHLGSHVVATASTRSRDFVRSLGAETVIDYNAEDLVMAIRSRYPDGVDKALNGVAGETADQVVLTLREGGRMVDLTQSVTAKRPDVVIDAEYVVQADAKRLARLARMIDDGVLTVHIQDTLPFDQAAKALELVLSKHVHGKIALKID